MKIVYAGIQAENYNPHRRLSFEYANFYLTLKQMPGVEVIEFPYDPIIHIGKKRFNAELASLIEHERPDLFFAFMFADELDRTTLDRIRTLTTSIGWFADDHWRLPNYSRHYAPHFTRAVTTWSKGPAEYGAYGIHNIIRSQWACNTAIWKPVSVERDIAVSFIGQRNAARADIIRALKRAGIPVWVRGWGWPEGRLTQDEMIRSVSRSKVTLNFNVPPHRLRLKLLARLFFKRSTGRIVPDLHVGDNARSWIHMGTPQIKARPFEILGCRTFLISGFADDMDRYYEDGKEIVYYNGTITDLVQKIEYYLARPEDRERIAQAGYERTLREHTYEARFRNIFRELGLL